MWGQMKQAESGGTFPPLADGDEPRSRAVSSPVTVKSEALFRGARELLIRHGEELYRLRATSKGKLILTK